MLFLCFLFRVFFYFVAFLEIQLVVLFIKRVQKYRYLIGVSFEEN